MKIIVQMLPDKFEMLLSDIPDNQKDLYLVDVETYGYFLNEVYYPDFDKFILQKKGKTTRELIGMDENATRMTFRNEADWHLLLRKHAKEFHKKREKFYLYKKSIYSYTYIGEYNVGHVIEIVKYNKKDLTALLNKLMKTSNLPWWKHLLNKLFSKS